MTVRVIRMTDSIIEVNTYNMGLLLNENKTLQSQNKKLRAALKQLVFLGEEGMKPDYKEWITFHDEIVQIARAALEGGD